MEIIPTRTNFIAVQDLVLPIPSDAMTTGAFLPLGIATEMPIATAPKTSPRTNARPRTKLAMEIFSRVTTETAFPGSTFVTVTMTVSTTRTRAPIDNVALELAMRNPSSLARPTDNGEELFASKRIGFVMATLIALMALMKRCRVAMSPWPSAPLMSSDVIMEDVSNSCGSAIMIMIAEMAVTRPRIARITTGGVMRLRSLLARMPSVFPRVIDATEMTIVAMEVTKSNATRVTALAAPTNSNASLFPACTARNASRMIWYATKNKIAPTAATSLCIVVSMNARESRTMAATTNASTPRKASDASVTKAIASWTTERPAKTSTSASKSQGPAHSNASTHQAVTHANAIQPTMNANQMATRANDWTIFSLGSSSATSTTSGT